MIVVRFALQLDRLSAEEQQHCLCRIGKLSWLKRHQTSHLGRVFVPLVEYHGNAGPHTLESMPVLPQPLATLHNQVSELERARLGHGLLCEP